MKKLIDYTKEELELMDYDDIAYLILEDKPKKMKTNDLFKKVCELLNLSEEDYIQSLPDFFELLTTDKRFIQLSNGFWDLKTRHSEKMVIEEDEEDLEELPEENEQDSENEEEEDYFDEETDDDDDDDLKDLVVIDDDDEENL